MNKQPILIGIAVVIVLALICVLPARIYLSTWHQHRGTALARTGDFSGAAAESRTAVQFNANNATAHNNVAWYLYKLGKFQEALPEARESIRLNPKNGYAHDTLGAILAHMGQYPEAVLECREAVRIRPAGAHMNTLGYALYMSGQKDEARRLWQLVATKGKPPVSDDASNMLAQYP